MSFCFATVLHLQVYIVTITKHTNTYTYAQKHIMSVASEDLMDIDAPSKPTETKPKRKRFEVKKWSAVAFWSWDRNNETCAICRNHLMEPCIECGSTSAASARSGTKVECPRAVGACNHSFHLHCISTWISKRNTCPLDSSDWTVKEVLNN